MGGAASERHDVGEAVGPQGLCGGGPEPGGHAGAAGELIAGQVAAVLAATGTSADPQGYGRTVAEQLRGGHFS